MRHYECIFKIQKVEGNVYSTYIRVQFHFKLERDNQYAYALLSV